MKKIFLILMITVYIKHSSAQGTLQLTSGAYITGSGASWIVMDNMNVVNNGSILLSATANTVKVTGSTATTQSGAGVTQLNNLVNNTSTTFILTAPVSLYNQLTLSSGSLASSGNLILKSTATNTAMVMPVMPGASSSGNVIVERYIGVPSAKRAWRLLTAPISGTQTIYSAWQNGGVYTVGIGTFITGPGGGNGLDAGNNYSAKTYNVATQALVNVTNTNVPISPGAAGSSNNIGYFIFVRGDRNPQNLTIPNNNNTTLSATGALQTGTQTFTASGTANNFTLISNPYASPVDFSFLTRNNLIKRFYTWDPNLNTLGGYVLVDDAGNSGTYTIVPSGGTVQNQHIQSGQAFFVQTASTAPASVTFNETNKSTTVINNVFRIVSGTGSLKVNLFLQNADNTTKLADGILVQCNNLYSNDITAEDAYKFININENLSVYKKGLDLALEKRQGFKESDTLFLKLSNTTQRSYALQISAENLHSPNLHGFLIDNYLSTSTPVDFSGAVTTANFTVTGDAASAASNRFYITFGKPMMVQNNNATAMSVYPNPVHNGNVNLQMNNMPKGLYTIRLLNNLGQTVLTKQINHAEGSSTEVIKVNKVNGSYLLEITKPDNKKETNKIIIN